MWHRWSERAKGFAVAVALYALFVSVGIAFAAWTTPRNWTTGELVTAAILNTHVRDNLNYLKTQMDAAEADIVALEAASLKRERVLYSDVTGHATSGTGATAFSSYTLPANTLGATGDALRITVTANGADTVNARSLVLAFGASSYDLLAQPAAGTYAQGVAFQSQVLIFRTGSAAELWVLRRTPDGGLTTNLVNWATTAIDLTANVAITTTGTSPGGTNDLVQRQCLIEVVPAP